MSQSILVGGTIGIDTIITPKAKAEGVLGGSASFASVAAKLFADHVELVSIVGQDFPAHYLESLTAKNIGFDGVLRHPGPSFQWTGEYFDNMNQRRTLFALDDVMVNWDIEVPEHLQELPIVVASCMVPDIQLKMLKQCRNSQLVLSDSMDKWLIRQPDWLASVISLSHITTMNEHEAKVFANTSNIIEAGKFLLDKGAPYAIVKQGEYGAMLFARSENGKEPLIFRCPAWPLEELVDPTGAGDSFLGAMSGYLSTLTAGKLPDFDEMKRAVVYGTIAASFTCESFAADALLGMTKNSFNKRLESYINLVSLPTLV